MLKATKKLTIALPKGRVRDTSMALLQEAGLNLTLANNSRALRHESADATMFELRNSDVPTYVELGIADAGIVGKDVLLESQSNVYEPVDLGFARCRMSLIRARGDSGPITRVASKYPNVAANYLQRTGSTAEVIKLAGNVELACLTGLADAVVDIVETGSTLRANHLEELTVLFHSSARLIVNRTSLKFKDAQLRPLIANLRQAVQAEASV
jgi:ATP phosphoribosyltransferase